MGADYTCGSTSYEASFVTSLILSNQFVYLSGGFEGNTDVPKEMDKWVIEVKKEQMFPEDTMPRL